MRFSNKAQTITRRGALFFGACTLVMVSIVAITIYIYFFKQTQFSVFGLWAEAHGNMLYTFENSLIIEEAPLLEKSTHNDFWLNSGGLFFVEDGVGKTIQGTLPVQHPWRNAYAASSPETTDGGYRPQNIFRLITRSKWKNIEQEMRFSVQNLNEMQSGDTSPHRSALFLMRHYDNDNLYYAGVRDDGSISIKKKLGGVYHELVHDEERVFSNAATAMHHLEEKQWIRMKVRVKNNEAGVLITLFVDNNNDKIWDTIVTTQDTPDIGAEY